MLVIAHVSFHVALLLDHARVTFIQLQRKRRPCDVEVHGNAYQLNSKSYTSDDRSYSRRMVGNIVDSPVRFVRALLDTISHPKNRFGPHARNSSQEYLSGCVYRTVIGHVCGTRVIFAWILCPRHHWVFASPGCGWRTACLMLLPRLMNYSYCSQ